jgi:hypothetical protein
MLDSERAQELADVLREAGAAHHQAFVEVDGADSEWASWYAGHIQDRFSEALDSMLTREEIVGLLKAADRQHRETAADREWACLYAAYFLAEMRNA